MREITLPENDNDFKMVKDEENKWRANKIIFGQKHNLNNVDTWKYLMKQGANIHANDDYANTMGIKKKISRFSYLSDRKKKFLMM